MVISFDLNHLEAKGLDELVDSGVISVTQYLSNATAYPMRTWWYFSMGLESLGTHRLTP
jgi:hypothetical protein